MRGLKIRWVGPVARALFVFVAFTFAFVHVTSADSMRQFSARCAAVYASAFRVPVELVDAVIQVESGWNPYAVSSKGAEGLMQLMPDTAIRFGVEDRFNIAQNVRGGVAYLAWLIRLFRGDLRLAIAAYYVGESQILLRGLAYSSPQVFNYVTKVAQLYRAMRRERARTRQ
ncbi:MAG TPA: lytic transglycosylase domain-containing protein [Candidatus Acidoferrales bacterium]|nr:lytic transglycosylase domain-containing protein [Candidatus Acidoferrales bacterium]